MANSKVDTVPSLMQEDFGTKVLITDRFAETYLEKSKREKDQHSRWCGGKGGWDNYLERWH
jgi:hypothetical protein